MWKLLLKIFSCLFHIHFFLGSCQHSLTEEGFELFEFRQTFKELGKWTEALNSDTGIQRFCTGWFRSFVPWIISLCPLEKFPGILGIKKDYLWFVIFCMAQCRYQIMFLWEWKTFLSKWTCWYLFSMICIHKDFPNTGQVLTLLNWSHVRSN